MSQRFMQQSARRLAVQQPTIFSARNAFAPAAALIVRRQATTTSKTLNVSQADASQILANQRLKRPVAPHLSIYQPQITWYGSALNRITGSALSGLFYVFGAAYLAAPLFGLQLSSAALAAGFAKWPVILKFLTKLSLAFPFTYHSFNGIRHLVWDMGLTITNKQVIQTGWAVVGISVLSAVGLALL